MPLSSFKLDREALEISIALEGMSGVVAKDCFPDEGVWYIIVPSESVGRAIGRQGKFVKILEQVKKKVKIIGFYDTPKEFVQSLLFPLQVEVEEQGNILFLKPQDARMRGKLFGRERKNVIFLNKALQRFFPEKEVKVK